MRRRQRQHVNPFGLHSLTPRGPLSLPARGPVEIDLGCGDGAFSIARGEAHPETFVQGLDIRKRFITPGIEEIARRGLTNVRLETCNLIVDGSRLFPERRIRRFFINFPDPLFKRRQRHRRWLTDVVVAALVQALEPGGEILFQSDVWTPSIDALGLFELATELENIDGEFTFAKERIVKEWTTREQVCVVDGRRIWRLRFRRV